MKYTSIIFLLFLMVDLSLKGQTRVVTGRIISEEMEVLPAVLIQNSDTLLLGKTDIDGRFKIEIQQETDTLLIKSTVCCFESRKIQVSNNCDNLDVILMLYVIYDFMPASKIDRIRKKRFRKLAKLYKLAFERGLFATEKPCYKQDLVSFKKE